MARVLIVGSVNMDLIVRCQQAPKAGETVRGGELVTAGGGKGANQAVAAARLGAQTSFVGRVGEDEFGPKLLANLQKEGIDVSAVTRDSNAASGVALILLDASGENRIVVMDGANNRMGKEEIEAAKKLLVPADIVLMQLEIPFSVVAEVARAARQQGVYSVLDAGPAPEPAAAAELLPLFDLVSPNESEASAITGLEVSNLEQARQAAGRIRELGAREVVLKLGDEGALWSGPVGEEHFPRFEIEPIDTTAAGDSFTACLAVELASGRTISEAIVHANAAGALACLKLGAQPSMPTNSELEAFLQKH